MKEGQCFPLHYSEEFSLKTKRKIDLRNIKFITSLLRSTVIPETGNTYVEMKNSVYLLDWEEHAGTLVFLLKYSKPYGITSYNMNNIFIFAHCNHCNAIIANIK